MKRIGLGYFIIPWLFVFSSVLSAQEEGGVTILTDPSGATVYLKGDLDLVANTPARLPENIAGRYKAEITRPGYETWKGELTFVPGSSNEMEIRLSRKTRYKAALRSFFIPGWGQVYSENKSRGYLITTGALMSAAAVYYADRRYDKKRSDFDIARANYNSARTIEDRIALKTISDEKQHEAYKAETDRNTAMAIGAAFWAYNVLDALLFFPDGKVYFPTVTALDDGASLTFTVGF